MNIHIVRGSDHADHSVSVSDFQEIKDRLSDYEYTLTLTESGYVLSIDYDTRFGKYEAEHIIARYAWYAVSECGIEDNTLTEQYNGTEENDHSWDDDLWYPEYTPVFKYTTDYLDTIIFGVSAGENMALFEDSYGFVYCEELSE